MIGARQNLSACETYLHFWFANCCGTLTTGPFIATVNLFLVHARFPFAGYCLISLMYTWTNKAIVALYDFIFNHDVITKLERFSYVAPGLCVYTVTMTHQMGMCNH